MGSTAKLDAIAAGVRPPGLDPVEVAERRLADPLTSWSCWPATTLFAAVLGAAGHDVALLGLHRRDPAAISFDAHSALTIDGTWFTDPYFGPSGLVSLADGGRAADATGSLTVVVQEDEPLEIHVQFAGAKRLSYRVVMPCVDRPLLAGLLDVSVPFSGVRRERQVNWRTPDQLIRVSERDGSARWQRFAGAGEPAPLAEERTGTFEALREELARAARWSATDHATRALPRGPTVEPP